MQVTKTSDGIINYPLYSLDGKLLVEDNRQTLKRTEYIYAGGRLVAKKIQPITSGGANSGTATTTYIHTDFLGSPVAETSSTGVVTRVERYTPYGEPSDMQLDVGPGFTGHATDVLTGLTYMQQRYYDAEIGRFISPDPVGPEEDFVNHFNRYNYAQNNPVRYTDPDGREVIACAPKCTWEQVEYNQQEDAKDFGRFLLKLPMAAVTGFGVRSGFIYLKNNPEVRNEIIYATCAAIAMSCGYGKGGVPKNPNEHNLPDGRVSDNKAIEKVAEISKNGASSPASISASKLTSSSGNGSVTRFSNGTTIIETKDTIKVTKDAPTGTRIKPTLIIRKDKD